eukprot:CAMPEP_0119349868 /NCGR_PEP_ID=MMETSP1333-20130426/109768_1 /TAXON_ID=418940 /ORGANISM="Scyphosphaera apsteinii, Strain RCC1455" /LENGTH=123 /DNA_ID=CAMNT_0007362471 /DNA_START=1539 /DNA_END=1906 /DNA_ORIENTATION=-
MINGFPAPSSTISFSNQGPSDDDAVACRTDACIVQVPYVIGQWLAYSVTKRWYSPVRSSLIAAPPHGDTALSPGLGNSPVAGSVCRRSQAAPVHSTSHTQWPPRQAPVRLQSKALPQLAPPFG